MSRRLLISGWVLVALTVLCGLGVQRLLLPDLSRSAQAALGAGGQLLGLIGFFLLALLLERQTSRRL